MTAGLLSTMHPVILYLSAVPFLITGTVIDGHFKFVSRSRARQRWGSQKTVFAERQRCQNSFIGAAAVSLLSWLVWGIIAWATYLFSAPTP